ncbi:MAG: hypothetical protein NTZ05_08200, partial [Chloroflexi bacterium]|nr:hypothetical protein [Chloroflexota bacterium]
MAALAARIALRATTRAAFFLRRLLVALAFVPLTIAMTWPLALVAATHVPSDGGDGPMFVWNLWWVKRAVWDLHQSPFTTTEIFYPEGVNLTFHTLTTLHGLLSIPLQLVFGVVAAANLLFLGSFVAAATGAWALARYGGASPAAAAVAGVIFAFSPYGLAQARGHYNLSSTWLIPLFALLLLRALDSGRLRWAIAAGTALAAMTLNEYQYGAFGLLLILATVPLHQRSWSPGALARSAVIGTALGATTALLLAPLLWEAALAVTEGIQVTDTLAKRTFFSADLTAFLTPSGIRWGGREDNYLYPTPTFLGIGGADGTVYLGAATLLLAAVALLTPAAAPGPEEATLDVATLRTRGRGWRRLWATVAVVFVALALGPRLHIFGDETFTWQSWAFELPMPYALLSHIPVLGSTRVPSRFTAIAMLALAMLAAVGVDRLRAWWAQRTPVAGRGVASLAVPALALALVVADVGVVPMMVQQVAPHPFYQRLAAESGDFAVLELPFGQVVGPATTVGDSGDAPLLEYYQTVHGKRLLGGYVAREDPSRIKAVLARPGLSWLASNGAEQPD